MSQPTKPYTRIRTHEARCAEGHHWLYDGVQWLQTATIGPAHPTFRFLIWKLSGETCLGCEKTLLLEQGWEADHGLSKSQCRRADRDNLWNRVALCAPCHRGAEGKHGANPSLRKSIERLVQSRMPATDPGVTKKPTRRTPQEILAAQRKRCREKRAAALAWFKDKNNGLSPTQVRYRKRKKGE